MRNTDQENITIVINMNQAKIIVRKVIDFLRLAFPVTLAKRIVSIILLCVHFDKSLIAELTGLCKKSVSNYAQTVEEGRIDELLKIRGGGRQTILAKLAKAGRNVEQLIVDMLNNENFQTLQHIADTIKDRFGVTLSQSSASRLVKKHGFKKLKCGSFPAKACAEAQRIFYETILLPLMKRAKDANDNMVLLFMDASHFVIGCDFIGSVYTIARRFICTFSGRQRRNVLAALDFVTMKILTVENDTYINAYSVYELLHKIHETYLGKEVHIILDNVRYQKCSAVQDLAKELGIILDFLPTYSPNLNLIERLWRLVKSQLRQKYYSDFGEFKARIDEIIDSMGTVGTACHDKLCRLIGEKVQLFDGMKQIDPHTLVSPRRAA